MKIDEIRNIVLEEVKKIDDIAGVKDADVRTSYLFMFGELLARRIADDYIQKSEPYAKP